MPTVEAGTRKLDYDFTTTPSTFHASAPGVDPNTISLQVIVSNPNRDVVEMGKITIDIPLGQEVSRDLSNITALPQPEPRVSGAWTISTANGTITISSTEGDSEKVIAPITFVLSDIVVNRTPGTVPLTITEFPPSGAKVTDTTTYTLVKEPANIPPIRFYTVPDTVNEPGQSVTLHWTSQKQDERSTFGLRIASVQATAAGHVALTATPFKSCVADGDCYTWQDGINGVVSPAIHETITFALDVVQARSTGERRIVESLETTVRVLLPTISQNSYLRASPTGRFVALHWDTENARSCSVTLDGVVIADDAPVDTYERGFLVTLNDDKPAHQFGLVAHATSGDVEASFTFPLVVKGPPRTVQTRPRPRRVALSPSMHVAVVGYDDEPAVSVVSLPDGQILSHIGVGRGARGITFRPEDGGKAIVATADGVLTSIDPRSSSSSVDLPRLPAASGACITPDGSTLLVTDPTVGQSALIFIDLAKKVIADRVKIEIPDQSANGLALSTDGKIAVITTCNPSAHQGKFIFVDVPTRQIKRTFDIDGDPADVAITADGQMAFVAETYLSVVLTWDIQVMGSRFFIRTGARPRAVAALPDGVQTLAASEGMAGATLAWTRQTGYFGAQTVTFPIPDVRTPVSLAVAPDGRIVVVADIDRDCIVML